MRRALLLVSLLAPALVACGGSGGAGAGRGDLVVVVSAPRSTQPWVAQFMARGAELGVAELNAAGGVGLAGSRRRVRVEVRDDAGSPQQAVAVAQHAADVGALSLVSSGAGIDGVAPVAARAHLPVFVVWQGGASVVDPQARPEVFRIAPADKAMARHLVDYVSGRRPHLAVITEDSAYGRDGRAAIDDALVRNQVTATSEAVVAPGATDVRATVLAARQSGADTLVVWAPADVQAAVVRAAREADWQAAVFLSPAAEDPLLRQRLADHPGWLDGTTFVSWRTTAEVGPRPYLTFRATYEARFGVDRVGVGDVVAPPTWATYPYDAVRLVAAAATKAGRLGPALLAAMDDVAVTGANGDERGFNPGSREGVNPDDMCFLVFHDDRWKAVTDDPLVGRLPDVAQ